MKKVAQLLLCVLALLFVVALRGGIGFILAGFTVFAVQWIEVTW